VVRGVSRGPSGSDVLISPQVRSLDLTCLFLISLLVLRELALSVSVFNFMSLR
jgi:hypothetical protein